MQYTLDTALWGVYRTLCDTFTRIFSIRYLARLFLLTCCLSVVWYVVMGLMGWYSPGFHLAATFSSVIMSVSGNDWGVLSALSPVAGIEK